MKWFGVLAAVGLLTGGMATEPVEREHRFRSVELNNSRLKLTFLPGSLGRLSSLVFLPEQRELLEPYSAVVWSGNPLFEPMVDVSRGIREMFWKMPMSRTPLPMQLNEHSRENIRFSAVSYANTALEVNRRVRLAPDSAEVEFSVELRNPGSAAVEYSLWFNLVPAAGSYPLLPVKGGRCPIPGRGLIQAAKSDRVMNGSEEGSRYFPAAAPWIGIRQGNLVWAMVFRADDWLPDGFFHSWSGFDQGQRIRSGEAILGSRSLRPGERRRHDYRLLVLPGLEQLHGITGVVGWTGELDRKQVKIRLGTAKDLSPFPLKVRLSTGEQRIELGEETVPAVKCGGNWERVYPLPENLKPGDYRLVVEALGELVELTGVGLTVK